MNLLKIIITSFLFITNIGFGQTNYQSKNYLELINEIKEGDETVYTNKLILGGSGIVHKMIQRVNSKREIINEKVYDKNDNLIKHIQNVYYTNGILKRSSDYRFNKHKQGFYTTVIVNDEEGNRLLYEIWHKGKLTHFKKRKDNLLIEKSDWYDNSTRREYRTYDKNNNLIKSETIDSNDLRALHYYRIFTYDFNNELIKSLEFDREDKLKWKCFYHKDSLLNTINKCEYMENGIVTGISESILDSNNKFLSNKIADLYNNGNEKTVEIRKGNCLIKTITYDVSGKITSDFWFNSCTGEQGVSVK